MANTEKVFQERYLPHHIRKELMHVLFGRKAAGSNDELYSMPRRAGLKRDELAPLYLTLDEVERLNNRRDLRDLHQEWEATKKKMGAKSEEAKILYNQYRSLKLRPCDFIVKEKRAKYFEEADQRGALRQWTYDLRPVSSELYKPTPGGHTSQAAGIGQFLRISNIGGQR